jgi:hypothetical protein
VLEFAAKEIKLSSNVPPIYPAAVNVRWDNGPLAENFTAPGNSPQGVVCRIAELNDKIGKLERELNGIRRSIRMGK